MAIPAATIFVVMRLRIHTVLGVFAVLSSTPFALQTHGEVTIGKLAPYPTPITNNAVTSVCTNGACTIYSFMGMTRPTDPKSITPASYKLSSPGTGPWIRSADAPRLNGLAKIAASAATCNGHVYLIGGYTVEGNKETSEHRFFRYDPKRDRFVCLTDVPIPVDDTVVGVYQDRYIYLISGWHGPANANTNAVQVYDTKTGRWQQATAVPAAGRFGHAGGAVDNMLVMIDGCASTPGYPIQHDTWVGRISRDDPTSIAWKSAPPSPFRPTYRAANSMASRNAQAEENRDANITSTQKTMELSLRTPPRSPFQGGIIFVGGTDRPYNYNGTGYDGHASRPLDQIVTFDPLHSRWTKLGGRSKLDAARVNSTNTRKIDAPTNSTTKRKGIPPPTMDHRGLVWFDGVWVTVGGMTGPATATTLVKSVTLTPD